MTYGRFSAANFEKLGLDTKEAGQLAKSLADEVLSELHEVVVKRLGEIVATLNGLGHNLKLEYQPEPGDIAYRDDWEDGKGYHCLLRVGADIVISTGYAHLMNPEDDPSSDSPHSS